MRAISQTQFELALARSALELQLEAHHLVRATEELPMVVVPLSRFASRGRLPRSSDGLARARAPNDIVVVRRRSTRSRRPGAAVSPAPFRRAAPRARLLLFGRRRRLRAARRSVFRPGSSFAKSSPRRSFLARGQPPRAFPLPRLSFVTCQRSAAAAKGFDKCVKCLATRGCGWSGWSAGFWSGPPVKLSLHAHYTSSLEVSTNPAR